MYRLPIIILALASSGFAGERIGSMLSPSPDVTYVSRHQAILLREAERAPKGQILVTGDSIAEISGFNGTCGLPAFNAGVSGAKTEDLSAAPTMARALKPAATVLAIGTNDVHKHTDLQIFSSEYAKLVRSLPRPLLLVQIPAVNNDSWMTNSDISRYNKIIRSIGAKFGLQVVDQMHFPTTADGVHETPEGAKIWRDTVASALCPPGKMKGFQTRSSQSSPARPATEA